MIMLESMLMLIMAPQCNGLKPLPPLSPVVWAVWAGRAWIGLGLLRFAGISALGSGLQAAISGWDFRLGFQAGGAGLDSNGLDCSACCAALATG